jgi:hypothetical protein
VPYSAWLRASALAACCTVPAQSGARVTARPR